MKTIEIVISPKGETTVQTKGFTGGDCREASKFVEQALGSRQNEQLTAEYHLQQSVVQSHQQII